MFGYLIILLGVMVACKAFVSSGHRHNPWWMQYDPYDSLPGDRDHRRKWRKR